MTDVSSAYRQTAVGGASAVQQVILLYERMVEDLRRAAQAIDERDIAGRTNAINHALLILGNLQATLNFEAGGDVARNLAHFYNLSRQKILEAQAQASKEILNEQISLLLGLRDAWTEVERANAMPAALPSEPAAISAASGQPRSSGGWSA
jgi:flagellar protein FliS